MGASIGTPAQGMQFKIEDTVPDTYLKISGGKTYNNNAAAPTENDDTNFDSTFVERSFGLPNLGDTTLTVQFNRDDVGQARCETLNASMTKSKLQMVYPSGWVRTTEVYITTVPDSGAANSGSIEGTITFANSGAPVWT